ncbi:hypothetical protein [Winogradskyella psychrotolerans]|uniref:hypothetical protein n=1 Tax=Winogradskyella psychrotolerans TaxID=1344585 RepID=UPI001C07B478|nr:hypothetical protein [Winogradskyella psychrotolerans]MBU2928629.1 hypothetical protein [Winogradskyella psychrotolerans]
MKTLQTIENQIIRLTTSIEVNYPELYKTLDESPITVPSSAHPDMTVTIMEEYLETLKQMLKQYTKTHNKQ